MAVAGKVVYGRIHREVGVMRPCRFIFKEDVPHASIEEMDSIVTPAAKSVSLRLVASERPGGQLPC